MIDETGTKYGRLIVVSKAVSKFHKVSRWLCTCACGNEVIVTRSNLTSENTKSCGCLALESSKKNGSVVKHGLRSHPLYSVWNNMLERCNNPHHERYADWGGRGISVCDEWLDVTTFVTWARASGYTEGLRLDRENNDGNYEPSNCRFLTTAENNQNQRKRCTNTSGYTGVKAHGNCWASSCNSTYLGAFATKEEALKVRNTFISENKFNNPLQEYCGE